MISVFHEDENLLDSQIRLESPLVFESVGASDSEH